MKRSTQHVEEVRGRVTETSNEAVVRKVFEDFNRRTDWSHLVADNVTFVDYSGKTHDKEGMRMFFTGFVETFPDCRGRIVRLISQGNTVAIEYVMSATHNSEWAGISATGKKFEYTGAEVYDFEAGKVKVLHQYFNPDIIIQYLRG